MKYLPLKSPIRYAIIAHSELKPEQKHHEEALHRQLVSWLMHKPVTLSRVRLHYAYHDLKQYGIPASTLARLDPDPDWAQRAEKYFTNLVPDLSGWTKGTNTAFALSLYSYQGGSERPLFQRTFDKSDPANKDRLSGRKRIVAKSVHKEELKVWNKSYEELMQNKISEADFWERKRGAPEPVTINVPYSYVWKALDNGWNNGIIPQLSWHGLERVQLSKEISGKQVEEKTIPVVVCRNLRALYFEEFYQIYKNSRHCKLCGAALRDGFKGEYCLKEDNSSCSRKRQTDYKRRQRELAAKRAKAKAKKLS